MRGRARERATGRERTRVRDRRGRSGTRTQGRRIAQGSERFNYHGRYRKFQPDWRVDKGAYNQAVTFFFSNFPDGWNHDQMRRTFKRYGRVLEIYVPDRIDKYGRRFGFVTFQDVQNVKELEKELDEITVNGIKLHVNQARFERQPKGMRPVIKDEREDVDRTGTQKKPNVEMNQKSWWHTMSTTNYEPRDDTADTDVPLKKRKKSKPAAKSINSNKKGATFNFNNVGQINLNIGPGAGGRNGGKKAGSINDNRGDVNFM